MQVPSIIKKASAKLFSKPEKWFYALMCIFGALYFTMVIANHYFFRSHAFDYACYNFALWDYSHFHSNYVPCMRVFGNTQIVFLQDHFSLMLIYLVPIYWLIGWLTGTYTILLVEVALILWSAWAIYKLVVLKSGDGWLGVFAVLYYFLLHGRYSAFSSDANILTMTCCLIPLFIYYFESRKYLVAAIIFVLTVFAREDMSLWFIFIFIVLITWHWKDKKLVFTCLTYIAASILYFVLLFKVFIPLVHKSGNSYALFNYDSLGANPFEAFKFICLHPDKAFELLFINQTGNPVYDRVKPELYEVYLVSGGFILFLRPRYLIWLIPIIAQKVWNNEPARWGISGYYDITLVTILPVSVFIIMAGIERKLLKYFLSAAVCLLTFWMTDLKMDASKLALPWVDTIKENIFDPRFFHPSFSTAQVNTALKMIPTDAKICASESVLPHLSQRLSAYEFPDIENAEYIAAFTWRDYYILSDSTYKAALNQYICNPNWNVIASTHEFVLLKKQPNHLSPSNIFMCNTDKIPTDSIADELFNPSVNLLLDAYPLMYFGKEPNNYKHIIHYKCDAEKANTSGDSLAMSDNRRILVGGYVTDEKAHSGKYSVRLRFSRPFGLADDITDLREGDVVKISAWRYSTTGEGVIGLQTDAEGQGPVYSKAPILKDSLGWELISASIVVPPGVSKIHFYAWDNGSKPIYIDDMNVYVYRWQTN